MAERESKFKHESGSWWPPTWWHHRASSLGRLDEQIQRVASAKNSLGKAIDEQITGALGETYEICRPCTDVEMAHAYCSSDIGK